MGLKDNLVSYWKLDEGAGVNAVDSNGLHDMTDLGAGSGAGLIGNAKQFTNNGGGSRLFVSHSDFRPNGVSFTCALWTKPTDFTIPSAYEYVASHNDTGWKLALVDDSPVQFEWTVTGGTLKYGTAATLNAWHFLVIQWDAAASVVYFSINNQTPQNASEGDNFDSGGITGNLMLGANPTAPTSVQEYTGLIDECGYWRRVLSADELTFLYNGGVGRTWEDLAANLTGQRSAKPQLGYEMKKVLAGGFAV